MYGARFGGSGCVICTSVPPGFWAEAGVPAIVNANSPDKAKALQRDIAMTGLQVAIFYKIARN